MLTELSTWYRVTRTLKGASQSRVVHCSYLASTLKNAEFLGYSVAYEPAEPDTELGWR